MKIITYLGMLKVESRVEVEVDIFKKIHPKDMPVFPTCCWIMMFKLDINKMFLFYF